MFKNNLSQLQIFSILMLGIVLCLLVFAWTLHAEFLSEEEDPFYSTEIWFRNGLIIASILILVPTLGLLTRKKWAVIVFIVIFWILGIVWTALLLLMHREVASPSDGSMAILIAIAILVYACLIAGILYLDNAYVLEPLGHVKAPEETLPDVLDQ